MDTTDDSQRPPHDEASDRTTGLVVAIQRHFWLFVLIVGLFTLVGFVYSLTRQRQYEAALTMMVSLPKIGTMGTSTVAAANFRPFVQNQTIGRKIVTEFELDKAPFHMTSLDFVNDAVSVEDIRNTSLLRLTVTLPDPQIAAAVANQLYSEAAALVRRVSDQEAEHAQTVLKLLLEESRTRYESSLERLRSFRDRSQVELTRKTADTLIQFRGDLMKIQVNIEAERAKLRAAELELAKRNRIDVLKRSITTDPAVMEAARELLQQGQRESVLDLSVENETISAVHEGIDSVVATSRATLASLERQRQDLVSRERVDSNRLSTLTALYTAEAEMARLGLEVDVARKVFEETATHYENARVQVASRSAVLQRLDEALVPNRPRSRGTIARVVVFGLLGAVAALAAVVALEELNGRRPTSS